MNSKMFNSSILAESFIENSCSKDFSLLSRIQLNSKADYIRAEQQALECANYLTSTPFDRNNWKWESAEHFLLLWINGTSDFTFKLNQTICKIIKSNFALLSIYFAYATKFVLENRDKSKDEKEICNNVVPLLMDYCKNQSN